MVFRNMQRRWIIEAAHGSTFITLTKSHFLPIYGQFLLSFLQSTLLLFLSFLCFTLLLSFCFVKCFLAKISVWCFFDFFREAVHSLSPTKIWPCGWTIIFFPLYSSFNIGFSVQISFLFFFLLRIFTHFVHSSLSSPSSFGYRFNFSFSHILKITHILSNSLFPRSRLKLA